MDRFGTFSGKIKVPIPVLAPSDAHGRERLLQKGIVVGPQPGFTAWCGAFWSLMPATPMAGVAW